MAAPTSREVNLLRQIDAAVDRMRAVTPDQPYVLSVPQDDSRYHHHSRHSADLWLHRTPFAHDDHPNQQYQTWYYHEPFSGVFHQHRNSHWVQVSDRASTDAYGRQKKHTRDHAHAANSAQSTPGGPPKKKISLAAYKNKQTQPDKPDTPSSPSPPPARPKPRDSANLPRMLSPLQVPSHADSHSHSHANTHTHTHKRAASPLLPPCPVSPTLPASIIASLDAQPYQPSEKRRRPKQSSKRLPSPVPSMKKPLPEPKNNQNPETRDTPQEADTVLPDSLLVTLRIPKNKRKDVSRLLQMKPRPAKTMAAPPPESRHDKVAVKRPQPSDHDDIPDAKRKKAPDHKQPVTPATPTLASVQKETPIARKNKDLPNSAALKRIESTDSIPNGTPSVTSHRENGIAKPSPSKAPNTVKAQGWNVEAMRLGKLGRDLKHAASDLAQKNDRESAALASLESFMCFILSFYCTERSKPECDPPQPPPNPARTWLTTPAFWVFVKHHCSPYPQLHGLACHLGVVCNTMIMLRLSAKRQQDMSPEETNYLHGAVTASLSGAREAAATLPLSTIYTDFPKTWKRTVDTNIASNNEPEPGKYAGRFTLSFGLDTEPLQAVRMGHSMLGEWCAKKRSGYNFKMNLGA